MSNASLGRFQHLHHLIAAPSSGVYNILLVYVASTLVGPNNVWHQSKLRIWVVVATCELRWDFLEEERMI